MQLKSLKKNNLQPNSSNICSTFGSQHHKSWHFKN